MRAVYRGCGRTEGLRHDAGEQAGHEQPCVDGRALGQSLHRFPHDRRLAALCWVAALTGNERDELVLIDFFFCGVKTILTTYRSTRVDVIVVFCFCFVYNLKNRNNCRTWTLAATNTWRGRCLERIKVCRESHSVTVQHAVFLATPPPPLLQKTQKWRKPQGSFAVSCDDEK